MFDTHCHLNFKVFSGKVDQVIKRANNQGVKHLVIPGADVQSSRRAVQIAREYEGVYATAGIHPHHIFKLRLKESTLLISEEMKKLEKLLVNPKVVAVGEVGLDKHIYKKTVYQDYQVDSEFIKLQSEFLKAQLELAARYKKSLIIHNRKAKEKLLQILSDVKSSLLNIKTVFHCCEPDEELLSFAIKHQIYIGVDGDVTYWREKQEFVKKIPLELLVLETDSPYLLPEPLRSEKKYPNEPKNLEVITEFVSKLKNTSIKRLIEVTDENAKRLFNI